MKSKKVITLILAGALSVGGVNVYARVAKNEVPKNVVMTESTVTQSNNTEVKFKKIAAEAFEKYLNEKVNLQNLEVREAHLKDQKAYLVRSQDEKNYYLALIDSTDNKILHLKASHGEPETQDYKNYPLENAKKLATDFVKENNILGKDYTLSQDSGKELNADKNLKSYFFYFKYDNDKECLVTVDKNLKKVDQFILFDEQNGPREEDKVSDEDIKTEQKSSDKKISVDENKLKEVAVAGSKKYFGEDVDMKNLDIKTGKIDDEISYMVYPTDGKSENCVTLDKDFNIVDIQANIKMPEGDEYQKYTYDEAKKVAVKFIKEKNIGGKNYKLLEELEKEQNDKKEPFVFFFPVEDEEGNRVMITVDKNTKKVNRVLF